MDGIPIPKTLLRVAGVISPGAIGGAEVVGADSLEPVIDDDERLKNGMDD